MYSIVKLKYRTQKKNKEKKTESPVCFGVHNKFIVYNLHNETSTVINT